MLIDPRDRGAVITENSRWMFDGEGNWRRTPRHDEPKHPPSSTDRAAERPGWRRFDQARFVPSETDPHRIHVQITPTGRLAGRHTQTSGEVLFTNLDTEPLLPRGWFGDASPWFPPSPVPGDRDLWPGELPFTAFGQYGEDGLDLRVLDQDTWWVDRRGDEHRIDQMSETYLRNVEKMLQAHADELHLAEQLRESVQCLGDTMLRRPNAATLIDELGIGATAEIEAATWLEATPLMRGLRNERRRRGRDL